jgi:hypothetical protein
MQVAWLTKQSDEHELQKCEGTSGLKVALQQP